MVYELAIGWFWEGKLLLPIVPYDFRPDSKTGIPVLFAAPLSVSAVTGSPSR